MNVVDLPAVVAMAVAAMAAAAAAVAVVAAAMAATMKEAFLVAVSDGQEAAPTRAVMTRVADRAGDRARDSNVPEWITVADTDTGTRTRAAKVSMAAVATVRIVAMNMAAGTAVRAMTTLLV